MDTYSIEELTSPTFLEGLADFSLEEIRSRRGECQATEESLSLRRRIIQGRLDIVQSDLCTRTGDVAAGRPHRAANLVEELPEILLEHGDRHLGPGRLTSLDPDGERLGEGFEEFIAELDGVADGKTLSGLSEMDEASVRSIADELDRREREVSRQRHQLHHNIDRLQEEIVRRYKTGEASVDGLLRDK